MALNVEWTEEAENRLDVIVKYLEENWSQTEVRNFLLKLEAGLEMICNNPLQQKKSMRKPNAYEYQLAPQTTIFLNSINKF